VFAAQQLLAALHDSTTHPTCRRSCHQHAVQLPDYFPLQVMNSAVAPEVESVPASVGEVLVAVAGLAATGVVAWSLATLKDTGRHTGVPSRGIRFCEA
jgi:hypothetical protein